MTTKHNNYTVRYESDGQVTRIHFTALRGSDNENIVRTAAGLLFLNDCCPGEDFAVYREDNRDLFVECEHSPHHYYRDSDDLWPEDASEIQDL